MALFSKNKKEQNTLKKLNKKVKKTLPAARYNHSVGVAFTAASMAMRYGADINCALIAGILHDCAKMHSGMELLAMCDNYGITPSDAQRTNPDLLHGIIGSCIAKDKFDIKDQDILNAIAYHTTGRAGMSLLEKIIFIADYIEPSRKIIPGLDKARELAFTDLDECIISVAEGTIRHLREKKADIDPLTQETLDFYKNNISD